MKKITSLLLTLTLLLPLSTQAATFPDLGNSPYREAIEVLAEFDVLHGYPDGYYRPKKEINRVELLKILTRAHWKDNPEVFENCIAENSEPHWTYFIFPDIPIDEWFTPYVCVAYVEGVIEGYPDGTFRPANTVNYVETLKIVYEEYEQTPEINPNQSNWYDVYVQDMQDEDIDLGVSPNKKMLREEVAEIIRNFMQKKKVGPIPTSDNNSPTPQTPEDPNWEDYELDTECPTNFRMNVVDTILTVGNKMNLQVTGDFNEHDTITWYTTPLSCGAGECSNLISFTSAPESAAEFTTQNVFTPQEITALAPSPDIVLRVKVTRNSGKECWGTYELDILEEE